MYEMYPMMIFNTSIDVTYIEIGLIGAASGIVFSIIVCIVIAICYKCGAQCENNSKQKNSSHTHDQFSYLPIPYNTNLETRISKDTYGFDSTRNPASLDSAANYSDIYKMPGVYED